MLPTGELTGLRRAFYRYNVMVFLSHGRSYAKPLIPDFDKGLRVVPDAF